MVCESVVDARPRPNEILITSLETPGIAWFPCTHVTMVPNKTKQTGALATEGESSVRFCLACHNQTVAARRDQSDSRCPCPPVRRAGFRVVANIIKPHGDAQVASNSRYNCARPSTVVSGNVSGKNGIVQGESVVTEETAQRVHRVTV